MIARLYDTINTKLSCDYKLHIGLMVADKLVIVLPVDVVQEHCSDVFDLIYEVSDDLSIPKKDISNYIDYVIEDKIENKEDIYWYNKEDN